MAGRRADPGTPYRVIPHRSNGYAYAATCETVVREDGSKTRRYTHWGQLAEGNRFVPNVRFLTLAAEERRRLTFPPDWDLSEIEHLPGEREVGAEPVDPSSFENKVYGDVWLLLQVAEARGVVEDLMVTFLHVPEVVNDILTLAVYPYLTGRSLSRLPRWQRSVKVPAAGELTPARVTRLTQSIRHEQVMEFFRLRISRQPEGALYACDSTTGPSRETHVAEIRYGRDKDTRDPGRALEVVVWSLTAHEPVYYRTFPGNAPDARTVRTIVADLRALGVEDPSVICDRGHGSADDIGALLAAGLPFLVRAKVVQEPVVSSILAIEWDAHGLPRGMEYDPDEDLWHAQFRLPARTWEDAEGNPIETGDGDVVCNAYLDMRERAAGLARLAADVRDERGRLEAMAADEMLARRASINKGLRYHRVLFERDGGGWACRGFEEARDKVARAEATCGFLSSLAHGVPGGAIDHLRACRTRDEQERYFEQTRERMGLDTQGCLADSSKAGRLFCLFVGLILSSAVRATWRSSPDLRKEFPTPLDVLDEMHDIRWCGHPDGTSHMTPFLASQVRICEAFGIEVPRECLSASEGRKADSGRGRESSKLLGRGTRPAQNRIQAHPASA